MKLLLIILTFICIEVYSQPAIKVLKTDSDSLWQTLKAGFPDIDRDEFTLRYIEKDEMVLFYYTFACKWADMSDINRNKIKKRLFGHINNRGRENDSN